MWAAFDRSLPWQQGRRGGERLVPFGGDGTPDLAEFAPAELGTVLGVSATSARLLIADALDLRHRLPTTWRRLQDGTVRCWMARRIASQSRHLDLDAAGRVDAEIADVTGHLTGARFENTLADAVAKADPAAAKARADAARRKQGVWLSRQVEHGYGTLVAKAPAPDLQLVDVSLDRVAAALTVLGDTDDHDIRRSKALVLMADPDAVLDLLRRANEVLDAATDPTTLAGPHDGTDPARRPADLGKAVLYVHVTDRHLTGGDDTAVVRVEHLGPILAGQVCDWLGHRNVIVKPVIDIPGIQPVDCYEVPDRIARAIRLRTPGSCFPCSPNLSGDGDSDHTRTYVAMDDGGPPGQTGVDKLGWLERPAHRAKTHGRWKATQPRSGCWLWRAPHGHYFLVDEHGTTPLGKLP